MLGTGTFTGCPAYCGSGIMTSRVLGLFFRAYPKHGEHEIEPQFGAAILALSILQGRSEPAAGWCQEPISRLPALIHLADHFRLRSRRGKGGREKAKVQSLGTCYPPTTMPMPLPSLASFMT